MFHYILMVFHECLDVYIQFKLALEEWLRRMYQDVPWIRESVDTITMFIKNKYNKFYKIRMEPDIDSWSNMSCISVNHNNMYSEEYNELTDLYDTYDSGISLFQSGYNEGATGLWFVKYDNICYYSRVLRLDQLTTMPIDIIDRTPSTVRFLSINYTHPKMDFDVPLELPKSIFFVGNQILCATSVLRMLEYTWGKSGMKYVFDMNYKLKIMDRNIKYAELSSNEYIELDVDSWTLCEII